MEFDYKRWEEENRAYFEALYVEGEYEEFCQKFCHEGIDHYTNKEGKVVTFVCSEEVIADTYEEGRKLLASLLLQKLRDGSDGC